MGERLKRIKHETNWRVMGVDPSRKSIEDLQKWDSGICGDSR